MAQPQVRVIVPQPEVNVVQPEREQAVAVQRTQARVQIREAEGEPNVSIARSQPQVRFERTGEPQIRYQEAEGQPTIRYERMERERTEGGAGAENGETQTTRPGSIERGAAEVRQGVRQGASEARADLRNTLGVGIDRAPTADNTTVVGIRDLEDIEVYNFRGEHIGDVDSVRVGPGGQVMVSIEHGGFFGIGEEQFALPVERFYMRGNDLFVRGITERDIEMMESYQDNVAAWRPAAAEGRLNVAEYQ